ncbi:glycosyltransferase family 4 protein [Marinobacter sp. C2H3]|uniref:glycosyltransferase family 4 protein n=1 Tax=Marinobacter sp. C2H3 TaxID=3119003 RepID=UPI00300F06E2
MARSEPERTGPSSSPANAEAHALATLHFLVPGDPDQNTGGYRYVRKLVEAFCEAGHPASVSGLEGRFPRPDDVAVGALDQALAALPDGALAVLDGLAMGGLPDVVARHSERLRLLALVHHPLADETGLAPEARAWFYQSERQALASVVGVITTSHETRQRLADYGVAPERLATAMPGVDNPGQRPSAGATAATWTGQRPLWLCVAQLSPRKAQHQLVEALAPLADQPWHCALVGATDRDKAYADTVRSAIQRAGLDARVSLIGEVDEPNLQAWYAWADGFVFPSVYEGYGMAIDEALADGLPVISSDGGALRRLHRTPRVSLYPAGDVEALSQRLQQWLSSPPALRKDDVVAASCRYWSDTARDFLEGLGRLVQLSEDSLFGADWLTARESADHRARSEPLTAELVNWLGQRYGSRKRDPLNDPLMLVDVGTGLGSNPVYLTPRLPLPHQWTLIEPDPVLRRQAVARLRLMDVPVSTLGQPLVAANMATLLAAPMDLLTASALIDLVSPDWLDALVGAVVRRQAAILIVLSYAGDIELAPAHPEDHRIREWINRHQHRDKGTGAALGPAATDVLARGLAASDYRVTRAASDWHLAASDPSDAGLIRPLVQGWRDAAAAEAPDQLGVIDRWFEDRMAALGAGQLQVRVGHEDLLALPPAVWEKP